MSVNTGGVVTWVNYLWTSNELMCRHELKDEQLDKIKGLLPERFGKWSSVHRRFSRWSSPGVFDKIFRILSADAELEFLLMDGTIVKAHQHTAGTKKKTIQSTKTKP